jgi:hypothetical protein
LSKGNEEIPHITDRLLLNHFVGTYQLDGGNRSASTMPSPGRSTPVNRGSFGAALVTASRMSIICRQLLHGGLWEMTPAAWYFAGMRDQEGVQAAREALRNRP